MKLNFFCIAATIIVACLLAPTSNVNADPCGMVPPIYTGPGVPIVRTGLQQTYVFYKDGVETFVIRPGFQGKVEDFGMLIPFPTPPSLRKVPDNVFEQIDNAIDPPEVVVDLNPPPPMQAMAMSDGAQSGAAPMRLSKMKSNSVVVLKEEAVGMYEVAVLAAGSSDALKKWMDQHKYQFPDGMEEVTEDYIELEWCFVAVKTKVGRADGAEPEPGQRGVDTAKPANSVFDGTVQGMGFRFETDELVVPMRLSAFNDGDLRNIVYLLTDSTKRIRNIPEEYVVRQVTGEQLFKNVTGPLPLRILGGTEKDIPERRRASLKKQRDPEPKNGVAKTLFSSDLLAVSSGNLSLELEEDEKTMLAIGERLGLRGIEYDNDIAAAQKKAASEIADQAVEGLASMTLTLVDGDFPRAVIANQNLTFANYQMPAAKNTDLNYDAKLHAPGRKKSGVLHLGWVDWNEVDQQIAADKSRLQRTRTAMTWLISIATIGMVVTVTRRRRM